VSRIALGSLDIDIKDTDQKLEFEVDESYELYIPVNKRTATLKAETVWGAIRGLETFSQLVQARPDTDEDNDFVINDFDEDEDEDEDEDDEFEGLYIPNAPIKIQDSPKYAHRGLMLGRLHFNINYCFYTKISKICYRYI
jgi:hexosaminidase